jgi:hypothetical protein
MSGQGEPGPSEGTAPSAGEQTVAMLSAANNGPGTQQGSAESQPAGNGSQPPAEGTQQQQTQATWGEEFLKSLKDDQRQMMEPLVKQWDAGVTRRFQELQTQIAPFRPLLEAGVDPADVQNALQIYTLLDQNPQYLYQLLKTELEGAEGQEGAGVQGQQELQGEEGYELPPQVQQRLDQLQAVVEALAQQTIQSRQDQSAQQEDAELEQYLDLLKQEKGDFDETYVLARMARGESGADAVDAWNSMLQGRLNGAGQGSGAPPVPGSNLPPILSGGGAPPVTTENIGTAKDKDVQSLVVNLLKQSAASQ